MSHTRKTPPIKVPTSDLPTDVYVGTVALDTTTNEQKVFNGTDWVVIELDHLNNPTIVLNSTGPAYAQIQGDIPNNWKNLDTTLKGLVIGTSCTSIGNFAFNNCVNLTGGLVIPSSVKTIGFFSFSDCSGLKGSLTIPTSVTSLDRESFGNCGFDGLLTIPNSITSIPQDCFKNCPFTGSLNIPDSITSIDSGAFLSCDGFTGALIIPSKVISIAISAFQGCSGFTDVTIPNSVSSIGDQCFASCSNISNINCYVEKSILDLGNVLFNSGVTTIHVRSTDTTWTAGSGQTIGGKSGITVIKDL